MTTKKLGNHISLIHPISDWYSEGSVVLHFDTLEPAAYFGPSAGPCLNGIPPKGWREKVDRVKTLDDVRKARDKYKAWHFLHFPAFWHNSLWKNHEHWTVKYRGAFGYIDEIEKRLTPVYRINVGYYSEFFYFEDTVARINIMWSPYLEVYDIRKL